MTLMTLQMTTGGALLYVKGPRDFYDNEISPIQLVRTEWSSNESGVGEEGKLRQQFYATTLSWACCHAGADLP